MAKRTQERESTVDKAREDLKKIEVDVCDRARKKLRLSEEVACADASLAQEHCRSAQYDRDLRVSRPQFFFNEVVSKDLAVFLDYFI